MKLLAEWLFPFLGLKHVRLCGQLKQWSISDAILEYLPGWAQY